MKKVEDKGGCFWNARKAKEFCDQCSYFTQEDKGLLVLEYKEKERIFVDVLISYIA